MQNQMILRRPLHMTILVCSMVHIQENYFSKVKHEEKKKLNKVCPFLPFVLICIWKDWSWFIFFVARKRHFQKRPVNIFNKPNFSKQSLSLWFQYPELLREDPRESDFCFTARGGGWGAGPATRCSAFCISHISVSKRHKLVLIRTSSQMNIIPQRL